MLEEGEGVEVNFTPLLNQETPSCIDLLLTNQPKNFQSSSAVETGLSDFNKKTVTVMKTTFKKLKTKGDLF